MAHPCPGRGEGVAIGDTPTQLEQQWSMHPIQRHNAELPELRDLLKYYEGQQRLSYMHPELMETLNERVRHSVVILQAASDSGITSASARRWPVLMPCRKPALRGRGTAGSRPADL